MDFQSAMETFAEAWVAANTGKLGLSIGGGNVGGSASSPGANAVGTTTGGMMAAVSSLGNPLVGALGVVGNSAAEQMSLAAAAAAAGSLIQQQLVSYEIIILFPTWLIQRYRDGEGNYFIGINYQENKHHAYNQAYLVYFWVHKLIKAFISNAILNQKF